MHLAELSFVVIALLLGPSTALAVLETAAPADVPAVALEPPAGDDRERRLRDAFAEAAPADAPATAALVLRDGRVLLRAARGLADMELGVPATPEHVFRIGSTTKPFTAALVLGLAREGRLSLDDPIAPFAPELASAAGVTVRHVLEHRSGIPSYTEVAGTRRRACTAVASPELLGVVGGAPRLFAPGEGWSYSNTGYFVLGRAIEKSSGTPYAAALAARVAAPLGLARTIAASDGLLVPGRVKPHAAASDGTWERAPETSATWLGAAGEIVSTVDDLGAFARGWLDGRIVHPEDRELAWTESRTAGGDRTGYGLGWFVSEIDGVKVVEHGGNVSGGRSALVVLPESRVVVAILHAADPSPVAPDALARRLARVAAGLPDPPAAQPPSSDEAARWQGAFDLPDAVWAITRQDDAFVLSRNGESIGSWLPIGRGLLRSPDGFGRIRLGFDDEGRASSLTYAGWGRPTLTGPRLEPLPAELCERLPGRYASSPPSAQAFRVTCVDGAAAIEGHHLRSAGAGAFVFGHRERAARVLFDLPEAGGPARALTVEQSGRTLTARREE